MNLTLLLARRYLFSRNMRHTIHLVSLVAMLGVATAATALTVTLSVFNGFTDLVASFYTDFDPQLKIIPTQGKTFTDTDTLRNYLKTIPGVKTICPTLENQALATVGTRQKIVTIKGVDDNYTQLINTTRILYGRDTLLLHTPDNTTHFATPGIQIAAELGIGATPDVALNLYAPAPGERINLTDPSACFVKKQLATSGTVFSMKQEKYDGAYIITSLNIAQSLFTAQTRITSYELTLDKTANIQTIRTQINRHLKPNYQALDRPRQQADTFRIMAVERLVSFLFLSLILLLACINTVGATLMIILEKQTDIHTLSSMGMTTTQVQHIFMIRSLMITTIGAIIGIILGTTLCLLQQNYGLVTLGNTEGNFVVDAYPVNVRPTDLLLILLTTILLTTISLFYPIKSAITQVFRKKTPTPD